MTRRIGRPADKVEFNRPYTVRVTVLTMAIAPPNRPIPVALTLQQGHNAPPLGATPTVFTWQQWLNRWWQGLGTGGSDPAEDLPHLSPLLAAYPKASLALALNLRLTTDEEIHQFNRDYRGIDRPTDVLAFSALEAIPPALLLAQKAAEDPDSPEPIELGDMVISLDTAKAQAQRLGHSLTLELAWLGAHGFLHLLGWDHGDRPHLEKMLTRQQTLLTAANLGTVNGGALDLIRLGYD
ncbi:MAG: rRNA maturation RNase YbeY [Cyanophyceae cyanobacterium]